MTLRNDAALEFLLNRRSRPAKTLTGPAPSKDELTVILEAGTRVPDHGKLEPWRLKVLEKPALEKIAVAAKKYCESINCDEAVTAKAVKQFEQGELGVLVIEVQKLSEKIPEIEQSLSAAAATQNMLLAAFAQGIGAMWRTGAMAYSSTVSAGLGLEKHEKIVGFLYLGASQGSKKPPRELSVDDFFQEW